MRKRSNLFSRLVTGGLVAGIVGSMFPIGAGAGSQTWGAAADIVEPTVFGITVANLTVGNDGTIIAGTGVTGIRNSTNSGASFGSAVTMPANFAPVAIATSPNFGTDRIVFAVGTLAGGLSLVASFDAGTTWSVVTASTIGVAGDTALSVAVAPNFTVASGGLVAVGVNPTGTTTSIFTLNLTAAQLTAGTIGGATSAALAGSAVTAAGDNGGLAVSFSPLYTSDGLLFGVVHQIATANSFTAGVNECRGTVAAGFALAGHCTIVHTGAATSGAMAFPSDFSGATTTSGGNLWVGSNGAAGASSLFRRVAGAYADTLPGGAITGVTSLAVSGAFATATVYAGRAAATAAPLQSAVYRSANGGTSWTTATIGGSTGAVSVALSPTFSSNNTVFASTTGLQGGVWVSTTGGTNSLGWTNKGLYQDSYAAVAGIWGDPRDGAPLFVLYTATGAGDNALFKASTAQPTAVSGWSKTGYSVAAAGSTAIDITAAGVSQAYASDSVVYIAGGQQLSKSTDGGASFSLAFINLIPSGTILAGAGISVANSATVFVATSDTSAVHKTINSGADWTTVVLSGSPVITDIQLSPNFATDNTLVVATRNPSGAAVAYVSTDGGAVFTAFSANSDSSTGTNRHQVAFDTNYATNKFIYAVTDSDVYRWTVGTSIAWLRLSAGANVAGAAPSDLPVGDTDLNNVAVVNGVLYTTQSTAAAGTRRALNPAAAFDGTTKSQWFDLGWVGLDGIGISPVAPSSGALNQGLPGTHGVNTRGMLVVPLTSTSNLILVAETGVPSLVAYTDLLLPAPTVTNPANAASVSAAPGTSPTPPLSWAPYTQLAAAAYTVRVSTDPTFVDPINTSYTNVANGVYTIAAPAVPAFTAGNTYYWQVRASESVSDDTTSPWSAVRTYVSAAGLPSLSYPTSAPGLIQTVDSFTPSLNWTAVTSATDYRVQIATNSSVVSAGGSYVNPVITRTVGSASPSTQLIAGDLQANTTYFWQVQAIFGTATGSYTNQSALPGATGVFRTPAGITPGPGGCVAPATALAPIASKLELAAGQDVNGKWLAYVPGLAGNTMPDICANTVVILTAKADTTVTVSGVSYALKAGVGKAVGVHASGTFS